MRAHARSHPLSSLSFSLARALPLHLNCTHSYTHSLSLTHILSHSLSLSLSLSTIPASASSISANMTVRARALSLPHFHSLSTIPSSASSISASATAAASDPLAALSCRCSGERASASERGEPLLSHILGERVSACITVSGGGRLAALILPCTLNYWLYSSFFLFRGHDLHTVPPCGNHKNHQKSQIDVYCEYQ